MNTKKLSALSLMIASAITLGSIAMSPGVDAFGSSEFKDQITHEVSKLSNGIQMTLTTDNAEALEHLQNKEPRSRGDVEVNKTNLTNGVQITLTSDDEDIVERLHNKADRKAEKDSIVKEINNLSNGVEVTITSTDEQVVEKIQSKEAKTPKNDAISIIRENISNGVRMTITTDDEELVERIQTRAAKKKGGKHGFGGKGKHKGKRGFDSGGPQSQE